MHVCKKVYTSVTSFLDELERVCAPNYVPTEQDVLFSRIETTGTVEEQFPYKDLLIR